MFDAGESDNFELTPSNFALIFKHTFDSNDACFMPCSSTLLTFDDCITCEYMSYTQLQKYLMSAVSIN
jgi:hypothetical protein